MMEVKGQAQFGVFAVIALVVLAAAAISGNLPTALVLANDNTCQPGNVLMPEYKTLRCEASSGYQGSYAATPYTGGDCPYLYTCFKAACPADARGVTGERCLVQFSSSYANQQWYRNGDSTAYYGSGEYYADYGSYPKIMAYGLYAGVQLSMTEKFKTNTLNMYTASGIFSQKMCDSCDLSCIVGTEAYNGLPQNQQTYMRTGDTAVTVDRWQSYPESGNVIAFLGQKAQCVKTGSRVSVVYGMDMVATIGGCNYARSTVIGGGECCPGETLFGMSCDSSTLKFVGGPGSCCPSGICSVEYCAGKGDWAWDDWRVGNQLKKYTCPSATGICTVSATKDNVECNPNTGYGCSGNKRCDPVTLKCVDPPVTLLDCVETGRECCELSQVPVNVKLRTCAEAGKPSMVCVNGLCVEKTPVPPPPGECSTAASCAVGDVGCFIQSTLADMWCSIMAAIMAFMSALGAAVGGFVVGLIIGGILMALLYWYVPQARAIMVGMPYVTIIAVIVIALVIAALLF